MKLTREQKAEKYRALPIAKVMKPLRFIGEMLNYYDEENKQTVVSPVYTVMERCAKRGDGASVQALANKIYRSQGV